MRSPQTVWRIAAVCCKADIAAADHDMLLIAVLVGPRLRELKKKAMGLGCVCGWGSDSRDTDLKRTFCPKGPCLIRGPFAPLKSVCRRKLRRRCFQQAR